MDLKNTYTYNVCSSYALPSQTVKCISAIKTLLNLCCPIFVLIAELKVNATCCMYDVLKYFWGATFMIHGLDDRGFRVRFPAGVGNFSLHHRVQNGSV
jgi:hypothetical protein